MEGFYPLIDQLEQAWTGVEETDRAIISTLAPRVRVLLIMVCPLRYTIKKLSDFVGILFDPPKAGMDSPRCCRG